MRKVRMDKNMLQREVAAAIGANEWTIHNWETNAHKPEIRFYPVIMNWLGYCPVTNADTLGEKIRRHRQHRGLSASELAHQISGVDPSTILAWEANKANPEVQKRSREKLKLITHLPYMYNK